MYLRKDEQVLYSLRDLYRQYGYQQYQVTKFEEYDLYVRNKNFLVSENMLTFTDTNGKLMALKPDITLSIVKNARPTRETTEKVYYSENVYRAASDCNGFQEITQTGLECLGRVDDYTVCEVLMLACHSLAAVTDRYLLQVSHLGFADSLLRDTAEQDRSEILRLICAKNTPALKQYCAEAGLDGALTEKLLLLADLFGPLHTVLPALEALAEDDQTRSAFRELTEIDRTMAAWHLADKVYLDFSIINDLSYYNGIVFQGYVDGLPSHILSGGRYDRLMEKMGKPGGGIGFAVYVSMLERFWSREESFDGDVLLLYDDSSTPAQIAGAVEQLTAQGLLVKAAAAGDDRFRCRETRLLRNGGMQE